MSEPKRHHYIPSFHLAYFSNGGTKGSEFWVTDFLYKKQYLKTPNTIGFQKDLYTLEQSDDNENVYLIENAFGVIETEASHTLRRILVNEKVPNHITQFTDYEIMINYIALLTVRTPSTIEAMVSPFIKYHELALKNMTSSSENWNNTKRKMVASGIGEFMEMKDTPFEAIKDISNRVRISVNQDSRIKIMLQGLDYVIPLLAQRYWTLYLSKDDTTTMPQLGGFICSDNPISIISTKNIPFITSDGFRMADTEISVPISKDAALVGRFSGRDTTEHISIRGMASINSRTSMQADRYLFHAGKNHIWVDDSNKIRNANDLLASM